MLDININLILVLNLEINLIHVLDLEVNLMHVFELYTCVGLERNLICVIFVLQMIAPIDSTSRYFAILDIQSVS